MKKHTKLVIYETISSYNKSASIENIGDLSCSFVFLLLPATCETQTKKDTFRDTCPPGTDPYC